MQITNNNLPYKEPNVSARLKMSLHHREKREATQWPCRFIGSHMSNKSLAIFSTEKVSHLINVRM
jgi:hypothetical protein